MRQFLILIALVVALACGDSALPAVPTPGPEPIPGSPVRVLLLTATAGFRHDSIGAARAALTSLATSSGEFVVSHTEDVTAVTAAALAGTDVLMFGLTSGELAFSDAQKVAILAFVNGGGGFVGVHSATDTLYTWPEYGNLVGAYFREHPWTQAATVIVEDSAHPAVSGIGGTFVIDEEFYTFQENPRGRVRVLLSLDASSVGATGDYPLAWTRTMGQGRVYYNALGHFAATWADGRFVTQIRAALRWAAGRS
jgi:type 1 glutamine amidotransferase